MDTKLAMRMYQEYTDFFKKAELERRWNVFGPASRVGTRGSRSLVPAR
jgi:hypothetical protein